MGCSHNLSAVMNFHYLNIPSKVLRAANPLPLHPWVKNTALALCIIICQSLKSALPEEKVAENELGAQLGKGLNV